MSHLHRSFELVLATRTNAYLVAIAAIIATGIPVFTRDKDSAAGYLSAPMVFALMRPIGTRKGTTGIGFNMEKKTDGYQLPFSPVQLQPSR